MYRVLGSNGADIHQKLQFPADLLALAKAADLTHTQSLELLNSAEEYAA
jgi:hypothetical protein